MHFKEQDVHQIDEVQKLKDVLVSYVKGLRICIKVIIRRQGFQQEAI